MAFDSTRGVTVLFGGGVYPSSDDTWEWNGTTWSQSLVNGPGARSLHAMTYDSARGVTVFFGGFYDAPFREEDQGPFSETWEYGPAWACDDIAHAKGALNSNLIDFSCVG